MLSGDAGPLAESAGVGALPDMPENVTQQLGADRAHNLLRRAGWIEGGQSVWNYATNGKALLIRRG